jgi:hypothetical protein
MKVRVLLELPKDFQTLRYLNNQTEGLILELLKSDLFQAVCFGCSVRYTALYFT